MNSPATLTWFARHEFRIAWRDWVSMMTAGKRTRIYVAAFGLISFVAFLHGMAILTLRNVSTREPIPASLRSR